MTDTIEVPRHELVIYIVQAFLFGLITGAWLPWPIWVTLGGLVLSAFIGAWMYYHSIPGGGDL